MINFESDIYFLNRVGCKDSDEIVRKIVKLDGNL